MPFDQNSCTESWIDDGLLSVEKEANTAIAVLLKDATGTFVSGTKVKWYVADPTLVSSLGWRRNH